MSHSLIKADRGTHVRILLASMVCVIAFAALIGTQAVKDGGQMAQAPAVVKANPTMMTTQDAARTVR